MKNDKKAVQLSNPDKLLFPDAGITKLDYVKRLHELSQFILAYTKNRNLTTIHYPDGVGKKSYYQKNIPSHAPDFVLSRELDGTEYIVMDSLETLLWMGNMAALEFHIPFNDLDNPDYPDAIVFDLDPSEGQVFSQVAEAALLINETLVQLGIKGFCKTSGATGLQIAIPARKKLNYNAAREVNQFFAKYFAEKYRSIFSIERKVDKRGKKIYFDYLQMWTGKTIICPYSPRATKTANVSAPLLWEELEKGVKPDNFTLNTIKERLDRIGDIYQAVYSSDMDPALEEIVKNKIYPQ
jgi:bifunctional non-homologous end joining protein LigD